MGSLIASVAILLGLVFGGIALLGKWSDNYWKEALPCGSSAEDFEYWSKCYDARQRSNYDPMSCYVIKADGRRVSC